MIGSASEQVERKMLWVDRERYRLVLVDILRVSAIEYFKNEVTDLNHITL